MLWIDAIILLIGMEALVLYAWLGRRGRQRRARSLLANLAAGACLMLAVRCALTGNVAALLAALGAALVAHLLDVYLRLTED